MTSFHTIVLLLLTITPSADRRYLDTVDGFTTKTGSSGSASTASLDYLPDHPSAVDPRRELSDEEAYEEECDLELAPYLGDSILQWSTGRLSWPPLGALGLHFPFHGECRVSPLRC